MIRLTRLLAPSGKDFLLKFSLEGSDNIAINVTIGRHKFHGRTGAVLSATQTLLVTSRIENPTMDECAGKENMCVASLLIGGVGVLELRRDGYVGDWKLGQICMTLRITREDTPEKGVFPDFTQE